LKRDQFIKEIVHKGCFLKRHGNRHDIYANSKNGKISPIPRHPELKNTLCNLIKKQLGLN
jgi:mRNA interferase HicA